MKWLAKLEYKYGKYYIRRLMMIISIGMIVVYLADRIFAFRASYYLFFSRDLILQGQVWRLLTFVFVPSNSNNPILMLLSLFIYYQLGTLLESIWGGFRFNLYYFLGIIGAIIAGFITGFTTNGYLNLSLVLALATLVPDMTFRFYFIIPVKAKWMLVLYVVMLAYDLFTAFSASTMGGLYALVTLAFSLLGYAVFCGRSLVNLVGNEIRMIRNRRNWRR